MIAMDGIEKPLNGGFFEGRKRIAYAAAESE
jgi:hypothetical protein